MPHSAVVDGRVRRRATDIRIPCSGSSFAGLVRDAAGRRHARADRAARRRRARRRRSRRARSAARRCARRRRRPRRLARAGARQGQVAQRRRLRRLPRRAPGAADDVSVAPLRAPQDVRRRARAPHGAVSRPGRCSSPPTAPSPPRPRPPLTIDPHARHGHAGRPAASGSTSRCRATASSTARERMAQVSYIVRDDAAGQRRASSWSGSPTASRSRAGSPGVVAPETPQTSSGTARPAAVQQRRPLRLPRLRRRRRRRHRRLAPRPPRHGARRRAPTRAPSSSSATPSRSAARTTTATARRRSAAAAATRARTSSPSAARRSSRRAAAS